MALFIAKHSAETTSANKDRLMDDGKTLGTTSLVIANERLNRLQQDWPSALREVN